MSRGTAGSTGNSARSEPGVIAMAYFPEEHLLVVATNELTSGWDFDGSAAESRLAAEPRWVIGPGARWLWRLPGGRLLAVGKGTPPPGPPAREAGQPWAAACLRAADHAGVLAEDPARGAAGGRRRRGARPGGAG
jgi:hypothetical protein